VVPVLPGQISIFDAQEEMEAAMKKQQLPCYEVFTRTAEAENIYCATCEKEKARRSYHLHRALGHNPGLRVDGQELTIAEADRLMQKKGA
jgi:hypothetical protein